MKRTVCLILAALMIMAMIPAAAFADTVHYDVWVNGVEFTSRRLSIDCGNGTATLKVTGDVFDITLDNAEIINAYDNYGIYCGGWGRRINIIVKGDNGIWLGDTQGEYDSPYAIYSNSPLTLMTNGSDPGKLYICLKTAEHWTEFLALNHTVKDIKLVIRDIELECVFNGLSNDSAAVLACPETIFDGAKVKFSAPMINLRENYTMSFSSDSPACEIRAGKTMDGSDAVKVTDLSEVANPANKYKYLEIIPEKRIIKSVDFVIDIPNDGEMYPEGEDISCVREWPAGIRVTGVEAVSNGRRMTGEAGFGDVVAFAIVYEVSPGSELASDFTVSINGEEAYRIYTDAGVRKAGQKNAVHITYNPDIEITEDLPATVEYKKGGLIHVWVKTRGSNLKYQWTSIRFSGGVKQKYEYNEIEGATGGELVIENADESYDGLSVRCVITGENGRKISKTAVLKLAEEHVHKYVAEYDERGHWTVCQCGDKTEKEDHSYGDWTIVKEATEKEDGIKERACSVCGYKESAGIPVMKHTHSYVMKNDETGHWSECSACGDIKDKAAHTFGKWKVIKEATETAEGLEERTCSACGYKQQMSVELQISVTPPELTTPFVDVPKDAYYYDATVWAFNAEPQITDGNGKDKFMPEQICTRGQVVTFLWRSAGQPAPAKTVNPFEDVKKDDYFYQPVLWAFYNDTQITDGTDAAHFSPGNPCRNSHILTFIYRAMGEPGKTGEGTWYTDAYNWARFDADLLKGTYEGTYDINAQCPRKNVVQYLYTYYTMSSGFKG